MVGPCWLFALVTFAHAATDGLGPHARDLEAHKDVVGHGRAAHRLRPAPAAPGMTVYGYYPYWGTDPSTLPYDRLTHVAIFGVGLSSDGSLSSTSRWDSLAPQIIPLAHAAGVKVDLCVISFEDSVQAAVLGSATKRAAAIAALAELLDEQGGDGVNVDFEGLDASLKDEFVTFIQELQAAVGEVYLATPAVDWSGAFDYDQLAAASDGMFIMGYDYHYGGGDPGPNDPLYGSDLWGRYALDWTVSDYLTYGATTDKIVLGLPLYGHWWPTTSSAVPGTSTDTGSALFMADAIAEGEAAGRYFDEESRTPYAFYDGGQLWYDDVDALDERITWAVEQGLQGIGFWALTYDDNNEEFWDMVSARTAGEEDTGGSSGGGSEGGGSEGGADTGAQVDSGPQDTEAPVARAGVPFMAYPGDTVYLDGSASRDPSGGTLRFRWTQVAGPEVFLHDGDTAQPYLLANAPGTLSFELVVNNGELYSLPDSVDVIIADPAAGERLFGGAGCGLGGPGSAAGVLLALSALARRRRAQ